MSESTPVPPPRTEAEKVWQAKFDADVAAAIAEIAPDPLDAAPEPGDDALIAKFEAAIAANEGADVAGELVAKPPTPDPAESGQVRPEPAKVDPAPEPAADKSTTGALLQLMEREKAFTDERTKFKAEVEAFQRERDNWADEAARSRGNSIDAEALKRVLLTQPEALVQALGIPLDHVSQLMVAAKLGDKAPDEIRRAAQHARDKAETYALRDRVNGMEQERAAQEESTRVRLGATDYVATKLSETHTPVLAAAAKHDSDAVVSEIYDEIVRDAANRMHRDPNGRPISFEEASRRVERRVSRLVKSSAGAPASAPGTNAPGTAQIAPAAGPAAGPKTPAIAPSDLRANKPLLPWQDPNRDNEVESALAEAMAYERKLRTKR